MTGSGPALSRQGRRGYSRGSGTDKPSRADFRQRAIELGLHFQTSLSIMRKTLQERLDAGDDGFVGGLTADKHSKTTGAAKATATRDVTDLLQKGALLSRGVGKATKYFANLPGWNKSVPD